MLVKTKAIHMEVDEDDLADGKKETLFFNKGKNIDYKKEYSEGESGSMFNVSLSQLKKSAQLQRIMYLWRKAHLRARGGAILVKNFYRLHKKILKQGTTRNLFGEKVIKDRLEQKKKMRFLIFPENRFKIIWNLVIIALLLYTAIFVPYKVAFIHEQDGVVGQFFEYTVDALFGLDIIVNFMSVYEDRTGKYIYDRKAIALNYLGSWFILDLLACFPFQIVFQF